MYERVWKVSAKNDYGITKEEMLECLRKNAKTEQVEDSVGDQIVIYTTWTLLMDLIHRTANELMKKYGIEEVKSV